MAENMILFFEWFHPSRVGSRTARRHRPIGALLGLVLLANGGFGCAGADVPVESPAPVSTVVRPKDGPAISERLVGGRVSALIFVEAVRGRPLTKRILGLDAVAGVLAGTTFDPEKDLSKVFVTAPSITEERALVLAEHTLSEDRVASLIQEVQHQPGLEAEVVSGPDPWTLKVSRGRQAGYVFFIKPNLLVVAPIDLPSAAEAFENTGGLPDPIGDEAAQFRVADPKTTLRARGGPRIPAELESLHGVVKFPVSGGLTADVAGDTQAGAAPKVAAALTRSIDEATSVDLGLFKVRAIRPPEFSADGDQIKSHVVVSASEADEILTLAEALIPSG